VKLTTYTPKFGVEVVKLGLLQSLTLDEAAKWISTPKGTFSNRASTVKKGSDLMVPLDSRRVLELKAGARLGKSWPLNACKRKC